MSTTTSEKSGPKKSPRRRLIEALAAVGIFFIPTSWKQPVVETVVLPAHAQTSPDDNGGDGGGNGGNGGDNGENGGENGDNGECTDEWTKSSLEFVTDYKVCNTGDGPEFCTSPYKIWYAEQGNPIKDGEVVAEGDIGPLGDDGCHDFTSELEGLCEGRDGGQLMVQVFQHPDHGNGQGGDVRSEGFNCPEDY